MSILSHFRKHKDQNLETASSNTKNLDVNVPMVVTDQVDAEPLASYPMEQAPSADVSEVPLKPHVQEGCACECGHSCASDKPGHVCSCKHESETKEIETIPLGNDEISSLARSGYGSIKDRFSKTFLLQKMFWKVVDNNDPVNPGFKKIKAKRIVELKAASPKHAASMIGWDFRKVKVVGEKDDHDGSLALAVDGAPLCSVKTPIENGKSYSTMSNGERSKFNRILTDIAANCPDVKTLLETQGRKIDGVSFNSDLHSVNVRTKRLSKKVLVKAKPSETVPPAIEQAVAQ